MTLLTEFNEEASIRGWRREGFIEGTQQKAVETARKFLNMKVLTPEQIAEGTGLSVEQVLELKKQR